MTQVVERSVRYGIGRTELSANCSTEDRLPLLLRLYALLVPLVVIPTPLGVSVGVVDLLFPLLVVNLYMEGSSLNQNVRNWFRVFVVVSFVSTAYAVGVSLTESAVDAFLPLFILRAYAVLSPMMMVLSSNMLGARALKELVRLLIVGASISCAVTIVLYALDVQIRPEQQRVWSETGSALRAGGLLGNSSDAGHVAAILGAISLTVGMACFASRKWLMFGCFALACYVVYISSSRAALLYTLVVVLIMGFEQSRGRRVLHAVLFLALGPLIVAAFYDLLGGVRSLGPTLIRFDVLNLSGHSEFLSSESRIRSWRRMLLALSENPLFGSGYGYSRDLTGAGDNSFLSMFVEVGILAGMAYIAFWISLLRSVLRLPKGRWRACALGLLLGEISVMLTVDTHRMWASTTTVLLAIGASIRLAQLQPVSEKTGME